MKNFNTLFFLLYLQFWQIKVNVYILWIFSCLCRFKNNFWSIEILLRIYSKRGIPFFFLYIPFSSSQLYTQFNLKLLSFCLSSLLYLKVKSLKHQVIYLYCLRFLRFVTKKLSLCDSYFQLLSFSTSNIFSGIEENRLN